MTIRTYIVFLGVALAGSFSCVPNPLKTLGTHAVKKDKKTKKFSAVGSKLFDKRKRPSKPLLDILKIVSVKHDGTMAGILAATQKHLLRPADKERWEINDVHADKKAKLIPLFDKLGAIQGVNASQSHYTYALLLGCLLGRAQKRLEFLVEEWKRGVRFDSIVILSGRRTLTQEERDSLAQIVPEGQEIPRTETQMMKCIFQAAHLPEDLKKVPFVVIDAATQPGARRSNTSDTIKAWLDTNPEAGTILAVSSQPFVSYQDTVLKNLLPNFSIQTIGQRAPENTTAGVYLDNLARWIYEENKLRGS